VFLRNTSLFKKDEKLFVYLLSYLALGVIDYDGLFECDIVEFAVGFRGGLWFLLESMVRSL